MKLLVLKENLKKILSLVSSAAGISSLPVLKNLLITVKDGSVNVSATNLEFAVSTTLPAKISEDGSITVPVHILSTLVNNISTEKIRIETEDEIVKIKTDNYEASLQTINAKEFPIIPRISDTEKFLKIDGDILRKALEQVLPAAASLSDFRPELAGIFFNFQSDVLKIVATDSFRLAEKAIPSAQYKTSFEKGFSFIIPAKNVQEIIKILPKEAINIYFDANQIVIKNDTIEIVSRLVEGNFPDYEAIIPKNFETNIHVSAQELLEGLKLSHIFSSRLNDVLFKSNENNKVIELFSQEAGLGENNYIVSAKIDGAAFESVFNIGYISDGIRSILKNTKSDKLFIGLNQDKKPSIFKSVDDPSFSYILMPIKQS